MGGEGTEKSRFPHVHSGPPDFAGSLVFPFILSLPFALFCSVKLFSVVPSLPEAVSSLLAQFLKPLSPPTSRLGFSSVLVLSIYHLSKRKGKGIQ